MNLVHVGWAMSAAGAVIFVSLGYIIHSLRAPFRRERGRSLATFGDPGALHEDLVAAEDRVEGLKRALEEERKLADERESKAAAETEAEIARLERALEDERERVADLAMKAERADATIESLEHDMDAMRLEMGNDSASDEEGPLVSGLEKTLMQERITSEMHRGATVKLREAIKNLEESLERQKRRFAEVRTEFEMERQRTQELLTEHYRMEEELAEERKQAYKAAVKNDVLKKELEKVKSLKSKVTGDEREFEIARSVRTVAERSWPDFKKGEDGEPMDEPSTDEAKAVEPKDLFWSGKEEPGKEEAAKKEATKVRVLEQRLRSLQEQQFESGRMIKTTGGQPDQRPQSEGEKVLSGEIGNVVLKLASKKGVHSAVLADAQGLPFAGVGLPRFRDGISAYSGLIAQLSVHARDFVPLTNVLSVSLFDAHDLVFSCWIFNVGPENYTLSILSAEAAPNELIMRRAITDLSLALR